VLSKGIATGAVMDNLEKTTHTDTDFEDYIRRLRPGDHAIVLYSTDEQRDAIAHLFLARLLKEDTVMMYVTSERSPEYVRKILVEKGLDVSGYEKKGLLYIQDGYYTIPPNIGINHAEEGKKMIGAFAKTVYSSKRAGGLGGIVETEGLFRYHLVEPLLAVESFFGKRIGGASRESVPPMIGLCFYKYDNLLKISGERQAGLIDSHSYAFFTTPQSESLKAEVDSFIAGISKVVHQSLPSRWIVVPDDWNLTLVEIDGRKILVLVKKSDAETRYLQVPGYHSGEEMRVGGKPDRTAIKIETVPADLRHRVEPRIRESLPDYLRYLHMIFW
jgi:hypothetical protein